MQTYRQIDLCRIRFPAIADVPLQTTILGRYSLSHFRRLRSLNLRSLPISAYHRRTLCGPPSALVFSFSYISPENKILQTYYTAFLFILQRLFELENNLSIYCRRTKNRAVILRQPCYICILCFRHLKIFSFKYPQDTLRCGRSE